MNEKDVIIIEKKVLPFVEKVNTISITTKEELGDAGELLTQLNRYNDEMVDLKESLTKPINASLKAIRDLFRPRESMVADAIASLRSKMGTFNQKMIEAAKVEEDKIAKKIQKGKVGLEEGLEELESVEKADKRITTDSGKITFKEVKKFSIENLKKLPLEYHLADEVKVRAAMKAGIELPGVKYWMEQEVVNRR